MDDVLFYLTAIAIPIGFVFLGSGIRYVIKRKKEWELLYFGVELTLAGLTAAFLHLLNPPPEPKAPPHPRPMPLLTGHRFADIMAVVSVPSRWTYVERGVWAILLLFFLLVFLMILHCMFEDPPKNYVKFHAIMKVFFLFILADLLGGGMMVYMERLLR